MADAVSIIVICTCCDIPDPDLGFDWPLLKSDRTASQQPWFAEYGLYSIADACQVFGVSPINNPILPPYSLQSPEIGILFRYRSLFSKIIIP
jgi:hypothetical protein